MSRPAVAVGLVSLASRCGRSLPAQPVKAARPSATRGVEMLIMIENPAEQARSRPGVSAAGLAGGLGGEGQIARHRDATCPHRSRALLDEVATQVEDLA